MDAVSKVLKIYRAYQDTLFEDLFRSTVQFLKYDKKDKPAGFGTGVLVYIDDHYFVFTAGHVIDEEANDLWVPLGGDELIRLGGDYLTNAHPDRKNDDIDIGVIVLSATTAEALKKLYWFITEDEIQLDHEFMERQEYLVFGYPATKTKSNFKMNKLVSRPLKYITAPGASNRYKRMKCDPDHRVLVHYDRSSVLNLKTGRQQKGPASHGMSGCGFWHIPIQGLTEKTREKKLVAILTDWPNGNWWIGTRVDVFTEFVRQRLKLKFQEPQKLKITITNL